MTQYFIVYSLRYARLNNFHLYCNNTSKYKQKTNVQRQFIKIKLALIALSSCMCLVLGHALYYTSLLIILVNSFVFNSSFSMDCLLTIIRISKVFLLSYSIFKLSTI